MPRVTALVGAVADLVCPERCAACPALVVSTLLFCAECRAEINVLGPPECVACGVPLDAIAGDAAAASASFCDACRTAPALPIRSARAWAAYRAADGPSPVARALAAFKYRGMRRLGRRFAAAMLSRVPERTIDLVVPVPLHVRRLRERGFNQSAVVGQKLARALGRPCALAVLRRVRDTPSQTALSLAARAANVAQAFTVVAAERIAGRSILLVDDVWTSGATARAAATALRAAGAAAVDVITIARVL